MKDEQKLEQCVREPDYLTVAGSRLYGTHRESSDDDFRGFTVPPFEYLIGVKKFKCRELEGDHKIYSLQRFLQLALGGDPEATERFFIPDSQVLKCSPVAKEILVLRGDIISMRIFRRILGYGYSEWRKAKGERLVVEDRTLTEDKVINDIRNMFSPDKLEMDQVIETLMSKKDRKVISSKKDLGKKRKNEFDLFGYGVSSAAHAIRLVTELHELVTTGKITFPLVNADFLLNMRLGKVKLEEAQNVYDEICYRAKESEKKSVLPDKPNEKLVWSVYVDIVKKKLLRECKGETNGGRICAGESLS
jgi:hypothetical protein